jgi:hypothetical protein
VGDGFWRKLETVYVAAKQDRLAGSVIETAVRVSNVKYGMWGFENLAPPSLTT